MNKLPNLPTCAREGGYPESSYLRAYKAPLHLSRTLYKSALFMQNKPNLLDALMNVKSIHTVVYENKHNWTLGENKPNQSQFPKSTNECKLTYNKGLQKKRRLRSPKKQSQNKANFRKAQMNVNFYSQKDCENKPAFGVQKNKPKQSQFLYRQHGSSFRITELCGKGRYINSSPVNRTTRYEIREYD